MVVNVKRHECKEDKRGSLIDVCRIFKIGKEIVLLYTENVTKFLLQIYGKSSRRIRHYTHVVLVLDVTKENNKNDDICNDETSETHMIYTHYREFTEESSPY